MELEYVACAEAMKEAVWLGRFVESLGATASSKEAVVLYTDSMAAL